MSNRRRHDSLPRRRRPSQQCDCKQLAVWKVRPVDLDQPLRPEWRYLCDVCRAALVNLRDRDLVDAALGRCPPPPDLEQVRIAR